MLLSGWEFYQQVLRIKFTSFWNILLMASVRKSVTRGTLIISSQVTLLKELKSALTIAVDIYVDKVLGEVQSWTEERNGGMDGFSDLNIKLERAIELFGSWCDEITGDEDFNQGLNKTGGVDMAMCSSLSSSEITIKPENDTENGQTLEETSILSEQDQENSTHRNQPQDQTLLIKKEHKEWMEGYKSQIENLERQIGDVGSKQADVGSNLLRQMEKVEQALKDTDECKSKIDLLNYIVEDITSTYSVKTDSLTSSIDHLSSNMSNQSAHISSVRIQIASQSTQLRRVEDTVRVLSHQMQIVSGSQLGDKELVASLKTRLDALEIDCQRGIAESKKETEEVGANYQIVCHLLDKRLKPLEQLRDILNKRIDDRDDNTKKLGDTIKELASLRPRLEKLEAQYLEINTGCSAHSEKNSQLAVASPLTGKSKFSNSSSLNAALEFDVWNEDDEKELKKIRSKDSASYRSGGKKTRGGRKS